MTETLGLMLAGLLAGIVDSIAGGGGLITLPALGIFLETGPHAIGTNKIAGSTASLVALWIYARVRRPDWRSGLAFAGITAVGSVVGSRVAPLLPPSAFKILLTVSGPLVLTLVWKRDLWTRAIEKNQLPRESTPAETRRRILRLGIAGLLCGFYDGAWGPGGGTLMLLTCIFIARLPLFTALAASKLANFASAFFSLISYAQQGYVHLPAGLAVGAGIAVGAWIGARRASRDAARVIRPVLTFVVVLLMARVLLLS